MPEYPEGTRGRDEAGRRYQCERCGSEIEIVLPTTVEPPKQRFQCCGESLR